MWYAVVIVAIVGGGVVIYLRYFAFVRRVYQDHGLDGVRRFAEAIPPPRSIDSVAAAVRELAKSRTGRKPDDGAV